MNGLSLFSNIGIAETYLDKIGYNVVVANELMSKRAELYKDFYPNVTMIQGDIKEDDIKKEIINKSLEKNVEFIIATPPCQGMSIAGKQIATDERNYLIFEIIEIFNTILPKFLLIENVSTLMKWKIENKRLLDIFYNNLNLKNYTIHEMVLNAKDYGTPQNRNRTIILIIKNEIDFILPKKQKEITVREAIGHLPSLESGEKSNIKYHNAKIHKKSHIQCMSYTPSGKSAHNNIQFYPKKENGERIKGYSTTYKRIEWDKPAPTITMANSSISSQNNVHPGRYLGNGKWSDARVLTLKELIILTGLPEDWEYNENLCSEETLRKLIGEGVPPKLIKNIFLGIQNDK